MQQKMSRKIAALMVFPLPTIAITQLAFFHSFWRRHTLADYRLILALMWVGLAVVVIFAVRYAQELAQLDREQWRARIKRR